MRPFSEPTTSWLSSTPISIRACAMLSKTSSDGSPLVSSSLMIEIWLATATCCSALSNTIIVLEICSRVGSRAARSSVFRFCARTKRSSLSVTELSSSIRIEATADMVSSSGPMTNSSDSGASLAYRCRNADILFVSFLLPLINLIKPIASSSSTGIDKPCCPACARGFR